MNGAKRIYVLRSQLHTCLEGMYGLMFSTMILKYSLYLTVHTDRKDIEQEDQHPDKPIS